MRAALSLLSILVAATAAHAAPAPIIGGTPAIAGQFPAVVYVDVGNYKCTGTLIAPSWVMTAATCLAPQLVGLPSQSAVTAKVRVHLDALTTPTDPGLAAAATIVDPEYQPTTGVAGDVGLIHLAQPVTDRAPVALNRVDGDAPVGVHVAMVGYGIATSGGTDAGTLRAIADVPTEGCAIVAAEGVSGASDADLLCWPQKDAGGAVRGICAGDSGGPLFAAVGGKTVQVGLASFGTSTTASATACDGPAAATRLDHVIHWIDQTVGSELGCEADGACAAGCTADPDCPTGGDAGVGPGHGGNSGGCAASGGGSAWLALALLVGVARRRRR